MNKTTKIYVTVFMLLFLPLVITKGASAKSYELIISNLIIYDDIWIIYGDYPGNPMQVSFEFEQYDENHFLINSTAVEIYDAAQIGNVSNIARNTPSFFNSDYDHIIDEIDNGNVMIRAELEGNDGISTVFAGYLRHICGEPIKNNPCPEGHIIVLPPSGESYFR